MQHSFDINIAKKYGIEAAIILNNLHFWHERNKANNKHFYDGKYWIYNSVTAWMDLFPYLSRDKIKNALSKLRVHKIIESANYNENKYDKTLWYGLTDFALSILQNSPMDFANSANPVVDNAKPIPIINTVDKTTIINTNKKQNNASSDAVLLVDYFNEVNQTTNTGAKPVLDGLNRILKEYSIDDVKLVIDFMADSWYSENGQNTLSVLAKATKFYEKLEKAQAWERNQPEEVNYLAGIDEAIEYQLKQMALKDGK